MSTTATKLPCAARAVRHLQRADPALARLIKKVGPCRASVEAQETFEAILEAIAYQQLNGKAAQTILNRVLALFGGRFPTPKAFLKMKEAPLRKAGLSRNKLAAMRDLAAKAVSGVVPPRRALAKLPDAEIIERLTEVRGVGVWTAKMFLMFGLGRPDVLPSGDFGIRKSFAVHFRKSGRLPPPSALEKHGKAWAPYRTVACWYLWRALDG